MLHLLHKHLNNVGRLINFVNLQLNLTLFHRFYTWMLVCVLSRLTLYLVLFSGLCFCNYEYIGWISKSFS